MLLNLLNFISYLTPSAQRIVLMHENVFENTSLKSQYIFYYAQNLKINQNDKLMTFCTRVIDKGTKHFNHLT